VEPFVHPQGRSNWIEILKIAFLMLTVAPLRLLLLAFLFVVAYLSTRIALIGLNKIEPDVPLSPKRRLFLEFALKKICRIGLFVLGFYSIKRIGKPNLRAKTVVSNHVSYIDVLIFVSEICPSFLAKASVRNISVIGIISDALQSVYVNTQFSSSKTSGSGTERIRQRQKLHAKYPFPQLLIFPEGTTTNGKHVIHFRRGAFVSSEPVQPVILKYPYSHFCPSWETIPLFLHVFLMLTQFYHSVEINWLPIYTPTATEISSPQTYANNVQKVIASALQVDPTNCTVDMKVQYHKAIISGQIKWTDQITYLQTLRQE